MTDRGYIGIPEDGGVTARYLHWAESPAIQIPALRAIWAGFGHDTHRMAQALLAEDWSHLGADSSTPEQAKATLPVAGSVVLITDPDCAQDDADPDQLYVVSEDVDAPYYQLVRIGGHGPNVPGYAITEIDPARLTLAPEADGAPPYRDILSRRLVTGGQAPDTSTPQASAAPHELRAGRPPPSRVSAAARPRWHVSPP